VVVALGASALHLGNGHAYLREMRPTNLVIFQVEPKEAWRTVMCDRWKSICPSCFDAEAELTRVRYQFIGTRAVSWSGSAAPANQPGKKRR
jgi:hypothetical protein